MSRVITFSRAFPAYHAKKGEPTHFVEKVVNSFMSLGYSIEEIDELTQDGYLSLDENIKELKLHTIRAGTNRKVGDYFSPRVWSGRPYNSQQITLAQDIQIKRLYNFEIIGRDIKVNGWTISPDTLCDIAENDGFDKSYDLLQWLQYPHPFNGQIICWDESIEY